MDFVVCVVLASIEPIVAMRLWPTEYRWFTTGRDNLSFWQKLALFLVQYLALKYYRIVLYHKYSSPLRHIPGPTDNHIFFGQTFKLMKAETPISLPAAWMKRYPDTPFIRYLGFGNAVVLVPNTVTAYKELTQTRCYSLSKPDWFVRSVGQMDGEGIFLMEGAKHRSQRRLLNGPFSRRSISRLQAVFRSKAQDICAELGEVIDSHDGVFECEEILPKATIEVMSTAVLGISYENAQPDDTTANNKRYYKHWTFLEAFESFFNPGGFGQLLMLVNGYVPIRWLPLEANREASSAVAWVHDFLSDLVRKKYGEVRDAMARDEYVPEAQRDLITFIVEEDLLGGKASGISEQEFVGHLIQTLGGGYDTTAIMLSWTCYVLAKKPEVQETLRNEILQYPSDLSSVEIDKLPYLDNFVKEVLRVYPPAPSIHRKADTDLVVEGVFIPKGTLLDIRPSVILMNPRIWGADAEEVDPTRWDRLSGEQISPFAYSVFSNGPRICVGRQFAFFLIKTVIVELVRNIRFVGVEKEYETHSAGFMYKPTGLKVRVERYT